MSYFRRWWAAVLVWIQRVFGHPDAVLDKQPPIWVARAKHGRGRKGTRSRWDYGR